MSSCGDWKTGYFLIVPLLPGLEYSYPETWPEPFDGTSQLFGPFGPYKLECWRGLSCVSPFWRALDASLVQTWIFGDHCTLGLQDLNWRPLGAELEEEDCVEEALRSSFLSPCSFSSLLCC